jgi:hypothetical protein
MEDDRHVRRRLLIVIVTGLVVCTAGCGSDNSFGGSNDSGPPAEKVIRQWADTLRSGDVAGAADFFALPSIVQNGSDPVALRTRADARAFNEALPCGARLLRTSSSAGYTTATFRLTERPGPGTCGTGTGMTARTTFVIKGGKIREWRRVADEPDTGPVV